MDWFEQATDPVIRSAHDQYPILNTLGVQYKRNHQPDSGYLEFWPGDEPGTPERPRPKEFAPGTIGVEIYDERTRPIDILGDVVSHSLIHSDPTVKQHYEEFESSMTEGQKKKMREQYQWARENEGEKRPFEAWREHTGLPGWFRGYAFQQWDNPEELYTPQQRQQFDKLMGYLGRK